MTEPTEEATVEEPPVTLSASPGFSMFPHYRYWFDMRSEPGDSNVAGGASDNYLAFTLRVGWEY